MGLQMFLYVYLVLPQNKHDDEQVCLQNPAEIQLKISVILGS